ncbi:helix-turn-helix domain-containing protein [Bradyrhizobium sp. HKCCYLRH3099]|uniref:helix-turn-helix domain-containing protein n=1 Tax=unclassified Bradyrhizobium TaxID=2631580 RepID=UPI003EC0C25E
MKQDTSLNEGCVLLLPRPSLAGCIFCATVYDTRHLTLRADERANYFPANPYCGINLFFEGRSLLFDGLEMEHGRAAPTPLPPAVFSGPQGQPRVSLDLGPVHVLWIGLYPDALQAMGGPQPAAYFDKSVDLAAALAPPLEGLFIDALKLGSAAAAFEQIQNALDPMWQAGRPQATLASRRITDWTRHLAMRAATTGAGRSIRQAERRFKTWSGQTQRELATLARSEEIFRQMMTRIGIEHEDWARLAYDAGYADQSHLVRQTKQATGFSPADLRRRIRTERPFWVYRLMGEL